MRSEFERALASVRDSVRIADLERLIATNDIDGVIRLLGLDRATFEPLEAAIRDSYRTGGVHAADILSPIPVQGLGSAMFSFDMSDGAATAWLLTNSSGLVVEIMEEQRQMIRERLAYSVGQGINPRTAALDLIGRIDSQTGQRKGGFVGLTIQQAGWVQNAREELESLNVNYLNRGLRDKRFDATVRKAIKDGKPLSNKQIDAAITSLQNRTQKYRGDVIARHESIKALRAGQYLAMLQAAQKGGVDPTDVTKEWDATGDARTREDHLLMEGQTRNILEPFIFIDGSQAQYPSDDSLCAPAEQLIQSYHNVDYRIYSIRSALRVAESLCELRLIRQ